MTDKEYQQKKRECWEEYLSEHKTTYTITAFEFAFDRAYALGQQDAQLLNNPKQLDADTVIQGWVARDSNSDLFIYNDKPKRGTRWDDTGIWYGKYITELASNLFPDLTWESEPQEVEIIIKRKKK